VAPFYLVYNTCFWLMHYSPFFWFLLSYYIEFCVFWVCFFMCFFKYKQTLTILFLWPALLSLCFSGSPLSSISELRLYVILSVCMVKNKYYWLTEPMFAFMSLSEINTTERSITLFYSGFYWFQKIDFGTSLVCSHRVHSEIHQWTVNLSDIVLPFMLNNRLMQPNCYISQKCRSQSHKIRMMGVMRRWKKFDDRFSRFNTIPACIGQTDWQTDGRICHNERYFHEWMRTRLKLTK